MFQPNMITQVVEWERRLEFEEENRKNHRRDPYVNYLAPVEPARKERKSLIARLSGWIFARRSRPASDPQRQPAYPCYPEERCQETQPG